MLGVVLVGFSAALYAVANRYLHRQTQDRLDAVMNTLLAAAEVGRGGVEWEPKERPLNLDASAFGGQVIWLVANEQGKVLDHSKQSKTVELLSDGTGSSPPDPGSPTSKEWRSGDWRIRREWIRPEIQMIENAERRNANVGQHAPKFTALSITVGASLRPVHAALRQLAMTLTSLTLVIWLAALFLGGILCRRALAPVNRMAVAASEINADDFASRLPSIVTSDELGRLNRAFNGLLDRLQESFERQQRFTGDASHQLRTPLTAILGQVEVALRRERPAEEYRRVLTTVHQRAGHLHRIVESLLFLARASRDASLPDTEPICLTSWLPQRLEAWSDHPRGKDIVFTGDGADRCIVQANPALLGELIDVLIDNACKFSESGAPINIRLRGEDDAICIEVKDRGCGIADADLPRLFTPFFRSEQTRRLGIEGAGLGLSIAQRLAEIFGGILTATSHVGLGSCFTLRLPLVQSSTSERHPAFTRET